MTRATVILCLVCFFFGFSGILYSQQHTYQSKTGKPIYKNGRFIFDGNSRFTDTILPGKRATRRSPAPFNTSQPGGIEHRIQVLDDNSPIVLYITTTDGYSSGSIMVQATNGTAPYEYLLTESGNYTFSQAAGNFAATAGTYTVAVKDANGFITSETVTIKDILPGPVEVIAVPTFFPLREFCRKNHAGVVSCVRAE